MVWIYKLWEKIIFNRNSSMVLFIKDTKQSFLFDFAGLIGLISLIDCPGCLGCPGCPGCLGSSGASKCNLALWTIEEFNLIESFKVSIDKKKVSFINLLAQMPTMHLELIERLKKSWFLKMSWK